MRIPRTTVKENGPTVDRTVDTTTGTASSSPPGVAIMGTRTVIRVGVHRRTSAGRPSNVTVPSTSLKPRPMIPTAVDAAASWGSIP
jgi:hypothetical protein